MCTQASFTSVLGMHQAEVEVSAGKSGLRRMDHTSWGLSDGKGHATRLPDRPSTSLMVERSTLAAYMQQEAKRLHSDL